MDELDISCDIAVQCHTVFLLELEMQGGEHIMEPFGRTA